jgi:hypothetical protein
VSTVLFEVFNTSSVKVISFEHQAVEGDNSVIVELNDQLVGDYRITLNDGKTSESCTVTKLEKEEQVAFELISASPDPTVDLFAIKFNNPEAGTVHVEVLDDVGRNIMTDNFLVTKGLNKIVLNLSSLNPGMYKIVVNNAQEKFSTTVIKQAFYN